GFQKALDSDPSLHLYCIGDGPSEKEMKAHVKGQGLAENIHFLGRIENDELLGTDLLSKHLAFVTMSNTENQPMTIIEAMHKRLPIIGPRSRGITELINENGILVNPDDTKQLAEALLKMKTDASMQKKMGKQSYDDSMKYNIQSIGAELDAFYDKVIAEKKKE
ncbi:MAG: glycosyltransferase family 4 protein, partial [Nanoarchaeota archaeon]